MAVTFSFKTEEDINDKQRTIVKTEPVAATEKTEEFTLEQKESQLASLKEQQASLATQVKNLEAEITAIKTALEIA